MNNIKRLLNNISIPIMKKSTSRLCSFPCGAGAKTRILETRLFHVEFNKPNMKITMLSYTHFIWSIFWDGCRPRVFRNGRAFNAHMNMF